MYNGIICEYGAIKNIIGNDPVVRATDKEIRLYKRNYKRKSKC